MRLVFILVLASVAIMATGYPVRYYADRDASNPYLYLSGGIFRPFETTYDDDSVTYDDYSRNNYNNYNRGRYYYY